ncbi:MAG: ATP-binding protein [Deltaproteobacteria bacterium]|nr:ATP-binding protein [Deltaproteobacteria bacterium]
MKISVASGKGGTGKTTVAINLALTAVRQGMKVQLLDCDVEEPNCHLFLRPGIIQNVTVFVPVPQIDERKCTACGKCRDICRFNAIAVVAGKVLFFNELCHGCGGCTLICPEGAIIEVGREIGVVEEGQSDGLEVVQGSLRVGEAMAGPLIRAVKNRIQQDNLTIIDVPPGTSCPVIEAVKGSDFVLLVTEPTPFGLNDLELAVGMGRELGLPLGVVINRSDIGDARVIEYCGKENLPVLMEIPEDRSIAEAYSRGDIIIDAIPGYKNSFAGLLDKILKAPVRRI